ncbi:MAG TPA: helix-turn-helix domain-containing protein [Dysgonomonas sp.]|uniref:helix-turn-helix domain-containing protein n=1 Tax=unclassified Dysgonomonas TaxID=2630389 RepID=UPI0025C6D835|nr:MULTISPECIES: helix-turn-helix domain-containing protein [unclassified Dysgonomonas]HML66113.1 helix-turn-helix domain-containing protein [Dysgonomonas sp.]
MEVITIEKETFEGMLSSLNTLTELVISLTQGFSNKKLDDWLDGQEVCLYLNISPRTLQTYRDTGKISFSQINRKIYYKSSDVEALIKMNIINP